MKVTISSLFFIIIVCFCFGCTKTNNYKLRKINLISNLPIIKLNGDLNNYTDTIGIYFDHKYTIYELPYFVVLDSKRNKKEFSYFIHQNGNLNGFYFRTINSQNFTKSRIDSFLLKKNIINPAMKFIDNISDTLIKENVFKNGVIEKIYYTKFRKDFTYGDSTKIYCSNNYKFIDISLSSELDKLFNSKVFKIEIIYNKEYNKEYKIYLSARKFKLEFRDAEILNNKEINLFIRNFEKNLVNRI